MNYDIGKFSLIVYNKSVEKLKPMRRIAGVLDIVQLGSITEIRIDTFEPREVQLAKLEELLDKK